MLIIYLLSLLFFLIFGIVFVAVFAVQILAIFTTHAPFVSIPRGIKKEIVKNLNLKNGDVLYDLGCGNAEVLVEAVKNNSEIYAVGVEVAFLPFWIAKFNARNYKNIKIVREDIFKTNVKDATHIFLYLYPAVINKLIKNIKEQCKSGTTVMSCDFELEDIDPIRVIDLKNISQNKFRGKKLFLYVI